MLFRSLARVEFERNSEVKFSFLFLGLSHPVLAKNNAGKSFFNFLNFLAFFFRNFLARVEYERNSGINFFFFSFLPSPNPFWIEIMSELTFLIFLIFYYFLFRIF